MFLRMAFAFEKESVEIARRKLGHHMIETYLRSNSAREINISQKLRLSICKMYDKTIEDHGSPIESTLFVEARREVEMLVEANLREKFLDGKRASWKKGVAWKSESNNEKEKLKGVIEQL